MAQKKEIQTPEGRIAEMDNKVISDLYSECKKEIMDSAGDKELLLNEYNFIFDKELGVLHLTMVTELYNKIQLEMAERYWTYNKICSQYKSY